MKRLIACSFAVALVLATGASAQIDPDPDGIGIYADLDAMITSVTAEIDEPIEVYLILTRPSAPDGIRAWECSIEAPPNAVMWGWTLPPGVSGGLFFIDPPNYIAAFGNTSLPPTNIVVLMTFIIKVTDTGPAEFFVGPHPDDSGDFGLPTYLAGDLIPYGMHPWPDGASKPAFTVVIGGSTQNELQTWGAVKTLYR